MNTPITIKVRFTLILLLTALLVTGCSGSNDLHSSVATNAPHTVGITDDSASISTTGTLVTFNITVPAYVSDALQVRLVWGNKDMKASWVSDESWAISDEFPIKTQNPLVVTFSDDNGAITLGSYETDFRTGSNAAETVQITAEQFDINRWDSDSDGVSNLAELTAGTKLQDAESAEVTEAFNFGDVADNLIHATSACQMGRLTTVVEDLAYIIEQTSTFTWPDTDWYQVQIVPNRGTVTKVFATVCNGGTECKLLPGRHALINHTSGENSFLQVPYIEPEENPNAIVLPGTSTDSENSSANTNLTRIQYGCENGGAFVRETGGVLFEGAQHYQEKYIFDQCRMTVRTGLIPDDNYLLNGSLQKLSHGNMYDSDKWNRYDDFSIIGDNGLEYHVQGNLLRADGYYKPYRQTADVSSYLKKLPGGQVGESMTDVKFTYTSSNDYLLNAQGSVQSDKTGNQQVTIRTDSALNYSTKAYTTEVLSPFTGSIEMLAEDGSFLYLNANPVPDRNLFRSHGFFMDLEYTTETGELFHDSQNAYRVNNQDRFCGYRAISSGDFRRSTVVREIP